MKTRLNGAMKFLITGFGPFLAHKANPSELVAIFLKKPNIDVLILPVTYSGAKQLLERQIKDKSYDFILSFGLAASRRYVSLEKMAFNEMNSLHPDNDHKAAAGEKILPEGLPSLINPLPLEAWHDSLKEKGFENEMSTNPGRYVCNEVYYLDLSSKIPCLFIHFPSLEASSLQNDISFATNLLNILENLEPCA